MTRVDELKDRIIDMIDKGCTMFGWTVGSQWHDMTIEQKADAILQMWDASTVRSSVGPVAKKLPKDVRDILSGIKKRTLA